ncbi:hypothetical protein SRHO_G00126660 [Serrasalmus rhombeus]
MNESALEHKAKANYTSRSTSRVKPIKCCPTDEPPRGGRDGGSGVNGEQAKASQCEDWPASCASMGIEMKSGKGKSWAAPQLREPPGQPGCTRAGARVTGSAEMRAE